MKTSQEIRQAMIQIADKNQRPHYTQIVVRAVIHAVKNDLDHPLKKAVIAEKIAISNVARPKTNFEVLKEFCATHGMPKLLATNAGISEGLMKSLLSNDRVLTDEMFIKLKACFDRTETEFANRAKTKKKNIHGTVNCYQNGCRCDECRAVYQERNQARLRQITEKYVGAAA